MFIRAALLKPALPGVALLGAALPRPKRVGVEGCTVIAVHHATP